MKIFNTDQSGRVHLLCIMAALLFVGLFMNFWVGAGEQDFRAVGKNQAICREPLRGVTNSRVGNGL